MTAPAATKAYAAAAEPALGWNESLQFECSLRGRSATFAASIRLNIIA